MDRNAHFAQELFIPEFELRLNSQKRRWNKHWLLRRLEFASARIYAIAEFVIERELNAEMQRPRRNAEPNAESYRFANLRDLCVSALAFVVLS